MYVQIATGRGPHTSLLSKLERMSAVNQNRMRPSIHLWQIWPTVCSSGREVIRVLVSLMYVCWKLERCSSVNSLLHKGMSVQMRPLIFSPAVYSLMVASTSMSHVDGTA